MTPFRVPLALVLVMVAVLLAAGCAAVQTGDQSNVSGTMTTKASLSTPTSPATVYTPCPVQVNTTPWIQINPIVDHQFHENFEINGTTNLGADTKIKIRITIPPIPVPFGAPPSKTEITDGLINILTRDCGIQKWSYNLNGSDENLVGGPYFVTVESENGDVKNSTSFNVYSDDIPVTAP
jgi:hypothetical protein